MQVKLSPVQQGVAHVQNIIQAGMEGARYEEALNDLHQQMSAFAMTHVREKGYEAHMRETDPDYVLTVEEVTSEANEETPMAECYWEGTSIYFRRVFQAAAAAA